MRRQAISSLCERVLTQIQIVQYSIQHTQAIWYNLLLLGYKPVQHVTVLNTVGNCNTMVSIIILYYNITGPPSYMRSVVDRNVVMRRILVYVCIRLYLFHIDLMCVSVVPTQRLRKATISFVPSSVCPYGITPFLTAEFS